MSDVEEIVAHDSNKSEDIQDVLAAKVESWRDRLLDLGSRNALINTRFSERSSVIEFDTPSTEEIWRRLAAESEAGADSMRFPWRRDLVPPPPDWQEYEDEPDGNSSAANPATPSPVESDHRTDEEAGDTLGMAIAEKLNRHASPDRATDTQASENGAETKPEVRITATLRKRKRREWNPPFAACKNSPHLRANDLLVDKSDRVLDRKLRNLDGDARLAMSEQGVHVLYVVFGFLKWYESTESTEERYSPLMLVPVTLSRDSTSAPWELTEAEDNAVDNLCLRQRLRQDFKLELPPLPEINELEEEGAREAFLNEVRSVTEKHERWEVVDKCVIGRFAFPKIAMWMDLGDHRISVTDHTLCRALGGDESAVGVESFGPVPEVPKARELDDVVPPGEIKTILDCDSSQLEAIVAARKGVSFVLDGPPGTGKSQTIANIIADALSVGRTVLFVSEKISALEVVKQRLEARQLDDFCLECHSDKANRRSVLFELERCLDLPAEVYQDTAPKLDELAEQRAQLNDYVRRIHKPREPLGLSAFELFGRVSRLTSRGLAQLTRCRVPSLIDTDRPTFDSWMRLLNRACDVETVIVEHDQHPWRGCKHTVRSLSIHDDIQHHFKVLSEQLNRLVRKFAGLVERNLVSPLTGANLHSTLPACEEAVNAPVTPLEWFDAPGDISRGVVALLSAEARRSTILSELGRFVDDVEDRLPVESAEMIARVADRPLENVIRGLTLPTATTVRPRLGETEAAIKHLKPLAESLQTLQSAESAFTSSTELDLDRYATIERLGQTGKATRLAASAGRARPHWFDLKRAKQIRTLAENALSFANKNARLGEQLEDLITTEQLTLLSDVVQESGEKSDSISVAVKEGLSDRRNLDTTRASIAKARMLVDEIVEASQQIASSLGGDAAQEAIAIPTAPLEQIFEALEDLEAAGFVSGSWRDTSVRDPLVRACDDAVADLTDAAAIRDSLGDRLSHRAFRESSGVIATRGVVYSSAWKRWFSGFGTFRSEAAELYNGEVPQGAAVASDMATLQKYHRRVGDVQDQAEALKPHVSGEFMASEITSWSRLKSAATAFERLRTAWPAVVASLPSEPHVISPGSLTTPAVRLKNAVSEYNRLTAGHQLKLPLLVSEEVSSIRQLLSDRETVLSDTGEIWDKSEEFTLRPIRSLVELDQLISALVKYGKRQSELNIAAERYAEWLPTDSAPTAASSWQAIRDGIDAVESFSNTGIDLSRLQARWCSDEFRNHRTTWEVAGQQLEDAASASEAALISAGLNINPVSLSGLAHSISRTIETLEVDQTHLESISDSLRTDSDVELRELEAIVGSISELRATGPAIEVARSQLDILGISDVTANHLEAAEWLARSVSSGTLTPLKQAVASDNTVRQQVIEALDESKSILKNADFMESWSFLKTLFDLNSEVSDGVIISQTPFSELAEKLAWLSPQMSSFDMWLKFAAWKQDVTEAGFGTVVEELITHRFKPQDAADVVAVQFYRQLFDRLAATDRKLGSFDIDDHERIRERFRFLDQWEVKASASRIRQYQLGRSDRPSSNFLGADSSELGILQKEIAKKRKHKPLRRLFAEIPTVLQRLKPCIMMSPLSVSMFLDTDDIRFDLVIFDEASQVFPWDALGAIYRGKQLIVAGDDKQLPPTNFFNRADTESDDDEDDIGDYESILSLCKSIGMPNQRLKWHYRSRREPLIAFSNRHFYDGELVTFPSVYDARGDGVRHELVPEGRWSDSKNLKEAERIVEMIVDHVKNRPDKSLGVIALNQSQQRTIEDTLYDLRRQRPEIDSLFNGGNYFGCVEERLFIKNLENVQGDERDVIFLSMGFGYNDAGKFHKNFGPIIKPNGERRLNVAVTRAREELVFVTSVRAADMDLSGSKSEGAHLLKAYLSYAEKGVDTLGITIDEFSAEAESPFEEEVAAALIRRGLEPVPQVGCGGFRIDLALKHPDRPGEFCLAVECDGATYHSSHTARDRDRIRQTILENLGWRIVRIWSTDWIRDPDRQIDRIIGEYDAAVAISPPIYEPHVSTEEYDELEPQFVEKRSAAKPELPYFGSIDEVPSTVIQTTAAYVLTQAGAMTIEDLIKQISRELGFRRLGGKIKARIEAQLTDDLESGRLKPLGERVTTGG